MKILEKKIAGLQMRVTGKNSPFEKEIPALWTRFNQESIPSKITPLLNLKIYLVYFDYEKNFTQPYSCLIGMETSLNAEIHPELSYHLISIDSYTLFNAQGTLPQSVIKTWEEIKKSPIKRGYKTDFEVYDPTFLSKDSPIVPIYISTIL